MAKGCRLPSHKYCSRPHRESCDKESCEFFCKHDEAPSLQIEDPILQLKRDLKELSNVLVANEKWPSLVKLAEAMQKIDQSAAECRTGFSSLLLAYNEGLEVLREAKGWSS